MLSTAVPAHRPLHVAPRQMLCVKEEDGAAGRRAARTIDRLLVVPADVAQGVAQHVPLPRWVHDR